MTCHPVMMRSTMEMEHNEMTGSFLLPLPADRNDMMRLVLVVLFTTMSSCSAFCPAPLYRGVRQQAQATRLFSEADNVTTVEENALVVQAEEALEAEMAFGAFITPETSIDNGASNEEEEAPSNEDVATTTTSTDNTTAMWSKLLSIASRTGRGEFATQKDKHQAMSYISQLEEENPTAFPTDSPLCFGKWELVFSNTQLFRSSPFFMAGRAVCSTFEEAQQYNWFCDMHRQALSISNIGAVRQVITAENKMVSEFETKVGAVPFIGEILPFSSYSGGLPLTIDGAIVSTADITPTHNGTAWQLYMDTVEIKGSNIPGVRQVLDGGLQLSSRNLANVLESTISSYSTPKPIFRTTYLDENYRIGRDQDDNVFVFTKVSEETTPTDYSNVMADLGFAQLLEGLNDAVFKFYL